MKYDTKNPNDRANMWSDRFTRWRLCLRSQERHMTRLTRVVAVGSGLSAGACSIAIAQVQYKFPSRPVRLIAPNPPGGGADFAVRELAMKLTEAWGQQVVVGNRPRAATAIGHNIVAKAPPDGYPLTANGTHGCALRFTMHISCFTGAAYSAFSPAALITLAHLLISFCT